MRKFRSDPEAGLRALIRRGISDLAHAGVGPKPSVCLGLSGGVDSMVLLELLAAEHAAGAVCLSALHVDHGLSPNAPDWSVFCARACDRRGIAFSAIRVNVIRARGKSLEEEARTARYDAFETQSADVIALAHHADDLAETVLLQLLRGAGPKGLAAMAELMPARRPGNDRFFWRPFLGVDRTSIARTARAMELTWVEDESNADVGLRRNYLRHRVMPVIAAGFPAPAPILARAARLQAEAAELLDDLADLDLRQVGAPGGNIDCGALAQLSIRRQANVLRRWLTHSGLRAPSAARLAALIRAAGQSTNDTRLQWDHDDWRVVRRKRLLVLERRAKAD